MADSREDGRVDDPNSRMTRERMAARANNSQFLHEMLDLFLPEAREWLNQIEVALTELEAVPTTYRAKTLLYTIRSAATNLGGSAATVGMPTIEQLAFTLLPHVEALESRDQSPAPPDCAALRAAFAGVKTAFELLLPDSPPNSKPLDDTHAQLIAALQDLQESRAQSTHHTKEVLAGMLEKLRNETGRGVAMDAAVMRRCLSELAATDEQVLTAAQEGLPEITKVFSSLRYGSIGPADLQGAQRNVARLRQAAHLSGAVALVRILQGLEKFLTVAGGHHSSIPADNLAAVGKQVNQLLPMVKNWIALGQVQRAAVEQVLGARPPHSAHPRKTMVPV